MRTAVLACLRNCAAGLLLVASSTGFADVRLPKVLSDGLIVQRDQPIPVWGWASPEKEITIKLDDGEVQKVKVENNKWHATLAPLPAGGPHRILIKGKNTLTINDVLVGELWVASGQSNMELPVRRVREAMPEEFSGADYPLVRQFTVPKEYDFQSPRADVSSGSWQTASSASIGEFSAAAYFFAKNLYERLGVPIGIVAAARGGASVEGWMSQEGLKQFPHYLLEAKQYADANYLNHLIEEDGKAVHAWQNSVNKKDEGLAKNWQSLDTDSSDWEKVTMPNYWADTSIGDVFGAVWFKKDFNLIGEQAKQSALLKLGRIVDADQTYINGQLVGETTYQYPPRRYAVKEGVLRRGKNVITVRVLNQYGNAGFVPDNPYVLQFSDSEVPLDGPWRYKVGAIARSAQPAAKFNQFTAPLGYYNAMMAPLLNLNIKGVIWYQGESNTENPSEYFQSFPALIKDWRRAWKRPDLPFIYVQLPNFMNSSETPQESNWAELREAQRQTLQLENTAMAVTIDVGMWNDIHPFDKRSVGNRLALAARDLVYQEKDIISTGPAPKNVTRENNRVVVSYKNIGEGLQFSGDTLAGFAVAGVDKKYYWARAVLDKNKVILTSGDVQNPAYVRYAWADNPDNANLYNSANLPAVPFQERVK